MIPTRQQLPAIALILLILTAFVLASCLLRHFVDRETAANVEAMVVVGVVVAVGVWAAWWKGR